MLSKEKIRDWLTPGRIIPLLTALASFAGNILDLFGIIQITVAENLILLALGLLAIDALTERIQVLSRIEASLLKLERPKSTASDLLISSYEHLPPLSERLHFARELWVSGTSLSDLIVPNEDLLTELAIQRGLKMRFLIVSPESPMIPEIANMIYAGNRDPIERFRLSLDRAVVQLKDMIGKTSPGQIEVRTTRKYPLFSLFIVDGDFPDRKVHVHLFNHSNTHPVIFQLHAKTDEEWSKLYIKEYVYLWNSASPLEITNH